MIFIFLRIVALLQHNKSMKIKSECPYSTNTKKVSECPYSTNTMVENLLYVIAGFAATYLSLELAWHFSACKIKDNVKIKPCMFKEMKTLMLQPPQRRSRGR
jgi:hypothetical protein